METPFLSDGAAWRNLLAALYDAHAITEADMVLDPSPGSETTTPGRRLLTAIQEYARDRLAAVHSASRAGG